MGPAVLDHSLPDWSVRGTQEDADRLALVHETIYPGNSFEDDRRRVSRTG
jgi:hypothetical protein